MFEIEERDGLARIAQFDTLSGPIETPAIMPVINPNIELISPKRLQNEFDVQVLITNSYIIYKTDELKDRALEKGIHDLLGFDGPIMTDSGTFQAHVYGDVEVKPGEILEFQSKIGSDISTILDEFTEPEDSRGEAERKLEKTVERAKKAKKKYEQEESAIAYPIQGSIYPDLRKRCGELLGDLDGDFYPIGGVVPLMEDYRFKELVKIILASKKGLGPRGPVHLFGAGHPMIYSLAVLLGCDLFDSSSYAKYAKREDLMFSDGTKNLTEVEYLGCNCPVCTSNSVGDIKGLDKKTKQRLIAEHNLWISLKEIEKIKQAVKDGGLWELVEKRVRSHPQLLKIFSMIDEEYEFLNRFEPRSRKRALFFTGMETYYRPAVKRIMRWVKEGYAPPVDGPTVLFEIDPDRKPYSRYLKKEIELLKDYSVNMLVKTPLGPIPLEMDEIYPIAQSIFLDSHNIDDPLEEYKQNKALDDIIRWDGEETLASLSNRRSKELKFDEMKIKSIADYQFCRGAGDVFCEDELEFVKNRKGRIKNVLLKGEHILSKRHYDGFFTLKKEGAEKLWKRIQAPKLRIKVTEESAKFNSEGKNIFAKFVKSMDSDLRPGDEAIVVTDEDQLVATARIFLNRDETEVLTRGLAARTREGFDIDIG